MRIFVRIIASLAVGCVGLGVILLAVSLLTGSGIEAVMTHQIVPPYIDAAMDTINGLLSRITGSLTAIFITA